MRLWGTLGPSARGRPPSWPLRPCLRCLGGMAKEIFRRRRGHFGAEASQPQPQRHWHYSHPNKPAIQRCRLGRHCGSSSKVIHMRPPLSCQSTQQDHGYTRVYPDIGVQQYIHCSNLLVFCLCIVRLDRLHHDHNNRVSGCVQGNPPHCPEKSTNGPTPKHHGYAIRRRSFINRRS